MRNSLTAIAALVVTVTAILLTGPTARADEDASSTYNDLMDGLCDSFWEDAWVTCETLRSNASALPRGSWDTPQERAQRMCDFWAEYAAKECQRLAKAKLQPRK